MRKVIIFILFTFLFIPFKRIKAINTNDLPLNENIKINGVSEKYKWYKLKKVDGRKENVFEHICEHLELKETDFSNWSTEKPEEKYGRIIEEKEETTSENPTYFAIQIDNILASNLRTKEIKLFDDNGKQVKYNSVVCYNCTSTFPRENLFDNNYNTYFEIKHRQPITLILNEETDKNIRVQFIYDKEDYLFGYRISKLDRNFKVLESKEENDTSLVRIGAQYYASYINSYKSWSSNNIIKYYRYKDAYLMCSEKEYLDGYFDLVENYIKDEKQFIKEYDYENVVVEPEIIEKEVFKEIIVPKEKIVNKYITIEKEISSQKEETKPCEYVTKKEIVENKTNKNKETTNKNNLKFYVIIALFLSLIVFLCLFLRELIKRCR